MLGEIRSADSKSGGGDYRQTNRHANDQEDESVVQQILRTRLGNLDVMKEAANPMVMGISTYFYDGPC